MSATQLSTQREASSLEQALTSQFALSYAQKRLWFLEQFDPGKTTYHVYGRFHLDGALDESIFRQSLTVLMTRHASLRTSFTAENGEPWQRISDHAALPYQRLDLTHLEPNQQTEQAEDVINQFQKRPFDLSFPPCSAFC